jgi:hypothetical protein
LRRGLGSFDFELLVAVRDTHLQRLLDGAQMLIGGATQVREAVVVGGRKKMSQNHADNSSRLWHTANVQPPMIGNK